MLTDAFLVAHIVARTFEQLGVDYLIGGSLASSIYGTPRSTQDVDFVADLREEHIPALVAALEPDFHIDAEALRRAIRSQRSTNLIHLATMYKADIFILKAHPHAREEMRRRKLEPLGSDAKAPAVYFSTAEDIVLEKLLWFVKGGGTSDKQWTDISNVLKHQIPTLDQVYLQHWAAELGLTDLLTQALQAAQLPPSNTAS